MDIIPEKACTGCGVLYAYTSENFYWVGASKTLLMARCKRCKKAQTCAQKKQERSLEGLPVRQRFAVKDYPQVRACKVCGLEKPFTSLFFSYASKITGQLNTACKTCRVLAKTAQVKANRAADPEQALATRRAWTEANRERIRADSKAWKKAHPESTRVANHRRRARKLASASCHTRQDVLKQLASQGRKCYWCTKKIVGSQYNVDHIFALAKGGSNGPENICISCRPCNSSKSAKEPYEFAGRLF